MFTALGIYFRYTIRKFKERTNSRGGLGCRKQVFSETNRDGHRAVPPNEEMRRERYHGLRGKGGRMGRNNTEEKNANTN